MASETSIRPVDALFILGMDIEELILITGLNANAVKRAVLGGSHMINYTVADSIAEALGVGAEELEWPSEITNLGRHAHTGRPLRSSNWSGVFCGECNLELPKSLEHLCS